MAVIDPQIARLKDGREVLLRSARENDAAALLEAERIVFQDGDGMISEADEFIRTEVEERLIIKAFIDDPKQLLLIAETGGVIIGSIAFQAKRARRVSH